jgi:hypothetical protein
MEGKKSAYRILVGVPDGKEELGRPRRGWDDNIKIGLIEKGWYALHPPASRQGPVESSSAYGYDSSGFINYGKFLLS